MVALALGGDPRWSGSAPVTCATATRMQPPWQTTIQGPPAATSSSIAPATRAEKSSHDSPSAAFRGPPRQFVSSGPRASTSAATRPPHEPTSISRQRGSKRAGRSPSRSAVSRARPRSLHTMRSSGRPSSIAASARDCSRPRSDSGGSSCPWRRSSAFHVDSPCRTRIRRSRDSITPLMFSKVLVANRGEIAVRVIRALDELGIPSVAVYSEADREAVHVKRAGEAYLLGPGPAAESYLNVDKLMEVIEASGAEAVHPGYGFLAENAAFARRLEEAGVTFIGPPASAIEAMGSKTKARELMQNAGVPIVPGTTDPVDTVEDAE